jgi:hypothetical protein
LPAIVMSSLRSYSDIDMPAAAARDRRTATVSSGTSRICTAFGIAIPKPTTRLHALH